MSHDQIMAMLRKRVAADEGSSRGGALAGAMTGGARAGALAGALASGGYRGERRVTQFLAKQALENKKQAKQTLARDRRARAEEAATVKAALDEQRMMADMLRSSNISNIGLSRGRYKQAVDAERASVADRRALKRLYDDKTQPGATTDNLHEALRDLGVPESIIALTRAGR